METTNLINKQKNKHRVLTEIIQNGTISVNLFCKKYGIKNNTINPTIKDLVGDRIIARRQYDKRKRGRPEEYFHLTPKGMKFILNQKKEFFKISIEQFFTSIFYAFDSRWDSDSTIKIQDLFLNFKDKYSKINSKIYPIYTNSIFEWTVHENKRWLYEALRVVKLFGEKEFFTANEIANKLISETSDSYSENLFASNGMDSNILRKMKNYGLVTQLESNNVIKFRITVFGLLILLRILYKDPDFVDGLYDEKYNDFESSNNFETGKHSKKLKFIQKTYDDLLPKILTNLNKLVKISGSNSYVVSCLILLFFVKEEKWNLAGNLIGALGVFDLQKAMGNRYFAITKMESESFLDVFKEWAKSVGADVRILGMINPSFDNKYLQNLLEKAKKGNNKAAFFVPEPIELFLELDSHRITTDDFLQERISIEKALTNNKARNNISETIEFQFFSILESEGIPIDKFLDRSGLKEWFQGYKEELHQFGINFLKERKNFELNPIY